MALHHQAQLAYGTPLGQSFQQAVQIKTGLGNLQQQRMQMEEAQRMKGQEQEFAQMAGQFKGNPRGAVQEMRRRGMITGQQAFTVMQGMDEKERAANTQQSQFDSTLGQRQAEQEATAVYRQSTLEQQAAANRMTDDRYYAGQTLDYTKQNEMARHNLATEANAAAAAAAKANADGTPASVKTIKFKVSEYLRLNPNLGEREAFERAVNDESDTYVSKAMQMALLDNKFFLLSMEDKIAYVVDGADVLRGASAESRGGGSGTSTNWQDYR